jgi:hypothetical protein
LFEFKVSSTSGDSDSSFDDRSTAFVLQSSVSVDETGVKGNPLFDESEL